MADLDDVTAATFSPDEMAEAIGPAVATAVEPLRQELGALRETMHLLIDCMADLTMAMNEINSKLTK